MNSSATVAVLFCDIVDSTARQVRLGDRTADDMRHRLFPQLTRCVSAGGGKVVKSLGDGLMVVFEHSTIGALECAVRMHAVAAAFDPDDPLRLRIGVSIGEVVCEDDDWFGTPVVEAARLCAAAEVDGTLAHVMVASLVGSRGDHYTFENAGMRSLKGLAEPVPVVELVGGTDASHQPLGVPPPSDDLLDSGAQPLLNADNTRHTQKVGGRIRPFVGALAVTLIVVGGAAVWRAGGGSTGDAEVVDASVGDDQGAQDGGAKGSAPTGYTPVVEEVACNETLSVDIPDVRCGYLVVPENRQDPKSRMIRVHFAMAPARSSSDADPVVMMGFNEHLNRTSLRDVADVYALSVRGFETAVTDELRCGEISGAWTSLFPLRPDDPAGVQRVAAAAGACAERLRASGVDLDGYNWKEVALDMRDLAIARSLDKVNIAAEGYLALPAVQLARSNPSMTATLLLTNPVAPGASEFAEAPRSAALELDHLDDLCSRDAVCSSAYGDLRAAFDQRVAILDADPVVVRTHSLDGEGPYEILLDGQRLGAALATSMRASAQLGLVPASMQGASVDLIAAVSMNDAIRGFLGASASPGASLSMKCSYDALPTRVADAITASGSYVVGAGDPTFVPICGAWYVQPRFYDLSGPLQEDLPVLVAEGALAASGVNRWGAELTESVEAPVLLRFDTLSEDLIYDPPACLAEIRNAFVVDPSSVDGVAECERRSPPIKWVTGT